MRGEFDNQPERAHDIMPMWLSVLESYDKDFSSDHNQKNLRTYIAGLEKLHRQLLERGTVSDRSLLERLEKSVAILKKDPQVTAGQAGDIHRTIKDLHRYLIELNTPEKL